MLAGNHNSNLDALAIMSLMPLRLLAAAPPGRGDGLFLQARLHGLVRHQHHRHHPGEAGQRAEGRQPARAEEALERGEILVLFPEGTRGEPETFKQFKKGIGHLARARVKVPVLPVFMYGLGKALPKGSALLVPFNVTVASASRFTGRRPTASSWPSSKRP